MELTDALLAILLLFPNDAKENDVPATAVGCEEATKVLPPLMVESALPPAATPLLLNADTPLEELAATAAARQARDAIFFVQFL
mmetsp:Transcript_10935/g.19975  ORF Transcript_10935/g.19975 Transcript_10935/m.19975 type:complete len:84 (+) Transcript_10935:1857-2108(+)